MNTRFDPELSRLSFEDRLIEYCEDDRVPLLERVRMLGIVADRVDVFFMTRVGRLKRLLATGEAGDRAAGIETQLRDVAVEAHRMMTRAYRVLHHLLADLAAHGVFIERWESLDAATRAALWQSCARPLAGVLRTAIVSPDEALPHVRNLRPALFAHGRRRSGGMSCTAVAELPAHLPRLVPIPGTRRFVPLEQVIASELHSLCPDLDVADAHLFRVTRNAETDIEDESDEDDVLEAVEEQIVRRPYQDVVRLEVESGMPVQLRERLRTALQHSSDQPSTGLLDQDMYDVPGLLDLTALEELARLDLPSLKSDPVAQRPARLDHMLEPAGRSTLLHFPFDNFETSIEQFLLDAARHPDLESLRTTIYRTDAESGVVRALRGALARGVQVSVVVELKASFDERGNIELSRILEAEGARVVLSPPSLKVHAKTALATFRSGDEIRRVALIGTGNMNAQTARAYIDVWLATSDPFCTGELATLFDVITGEQPAAGFRCMMASPFGMRRRFVKLIEREVEHARAGRPSGIRALMNGLTDSTVIASLHRASQAGVPIHLMVRGVCVLRPGVPGLSANIRVVSVAGQLLQHARVFHFRNGGADEYFIGSADWRPRNFDRRVEVVTPVPAAHHAVLDSIVTGTLATPDAWELGEDGVYARRAASAAPALVRAAVRT